MAKTGYHQDYIARIRYSNALPAPPCPPKLLDIPNTGLSSGHYTSAGFASRLAREQPMNIEADAELGMPIDLVGIPGVFDGDETAIQALSHPAPLPAADRALMRPPNALGKASGNASGAAFLRRTEYITASTAGNISKFESSSSTNTMRLKKRRPRTTASEDDPINIVRNIVKGFDLAYPKDAYTGPDTADNLRGAESTSEEMRAWSQPRHPRNPGLKLLDSYPLLPDFDAMPDGGTYAMYKFKGAPFKNPDDASYDPRVDVALLRPLSTSVQDQERLIREQEAQKEDPTLPNPIPSYHYEFFLPPDGSKVAGIKRNFTTHDPDGSDIPFDEGVDDEGRPRKFFKYDFVRTYETYAQKGSNDHTGYNDSVALALHDPEKHRNEKLRDTKTQRAAYIYPIGRKTSIRPRNPTNVPQMSEEVQNVHVIETAARAPDAEAERRDIIRRGFDPLDG